MLMPPLLTQESVQCRPEGQRCSLQLELVATRSLICSQTPTPKPTPFLHIHTCTHTDTRTGYSTPSENVPGGRRELKNLALRPHSRPCPGAAEVGVFWSLCWCSCHCRGSFSTVPFLLTIITKQWRFSRLSICVRHSSWPRLPFSCVSGPSWE